MAQKLEPYYTEGVIEAGTDEAGRGCLSGPVCAAAVILPPDYSNKILNDSKQLSEKVRYKLREEIYKEAISWGVAMLDHKVIDEINILNASIQAMHLSLAKLTPQPESILVDGNKFKPYNDIPSHCMIKGDGRFLSIAAASILAKTCRDDYMIELDKDFPEYKWAKNKGYPTKEHRMAVEKYGVTPYHRLTFNKMHNQLKFNL